MNKKITSEFRIETITYVVNLFTRFKLSKYISKYTVGGYTCMDTRDNAQ